MSRLNNIFLMTHNLRLSLWELSSGPSLKILRYLSRVFQHKIEDERLNDWKESGLRGKFWGLRKQMVEGHIELWEEA